MAPSLALMLLALALVLPVLGALVLRLLVARLASNQLYGAAAAIFGIAVVSVLVLARSQVPSLTIGSLSLLLPISGPAEMELPPLTIGPPLEEPPPAVIMPTEQLAPTEPISTAAPEVTVAPTRAPATATASATPTRTPTATPTPEPPTATPTAEPTAEPPTAAPARRTYTVQPGDTLRSIAEEFDVTVPALLEINRLTPEQADSLRVGQELVIP